MAVLTRPSLTRATSQRGVDPRRRSRIDWAGYLYLAPFGVLLAVFGVWPLLFGLWISLWEWGIKPVEFVGLANYADLFTEDMITRGADGGLAVGPIGQSVLNTLYYSVGTVAVTVVLAFVIASALFRITWLRSLLKVLFFLPYATTLVASALVFVWIFNPQFGVANAVLSALDVPQQTWLNDADPVLLKLLHAVGFHALDGVPSPLLGPSVALVVVIVFSIWNSLGLAIMIYLSGMTTIPTEVLEAAELDGATGWRRMREITLPLLAPTTLFLLLYLTVSSFKAFTQIFALTQGGGAAGAGTRMAGGPLGSTNVLTVEIFNGFYQRTNEVGYAAAVSFFLLGILMVVSFVQFRLVGRSAHYG